MLIKSKKELESLMLKRAEKALNLIAEDVYNILRTNISLYTYGYDVESPDVKGPINEVYENGTQEPTYEFRDEAWVKQEAKIAANKIATAIYYDGMRMSPPTSSHPYRHGYFNEETGGAIDRRAYLADILNVFGVAGGRDWAPKKLEEIGKVRKPFFDITLFQLENQWNSIVRKNFAKVGLN